MGVFKKNGDWWIDCYVNGRRKREKIDPNTRLAETVLQKRKEVKVLFDDLVKQYLKFAKTYKRSYRTNVDQLRHLLEFFGDKYLAEITTHLVENYVSQRKQKVKEATVNRELALLKHMFTKAIEWGIVTHNPAKAVKFFKESPMMLRYLTNEEMDRLLTAAPGHLKPILIAALNTGMRRGEILNLRWENVDFKAGVITLVHTKNGDKRHIPISPTLREALLNVPRHFRSPYVFCNKDGKPYWELKRSFKTALKTAAIENFRFHGLRHTFASHLVMNRVDLLTVKELLGHKTLEMTLRYAHLSSDHKKKAILSLERIGGHQMDTREDILQAGHR